MGIFSKLLPPLVGAVGSQLALAAIFVPQANEHFFDIGGFMGYATTMWLSLYYPSLRDKFVLGKPGALPHITSFAPRQILLTGCLSVWSLRLGSFLLQRAFRHGGDSRFDDVRHRPVKFTLYWLAQASWIFIVGLPVYLINTLPPHAVPPLVGRDFLSLGFFATSFLFEIIADRQKSAWRRAKNAKEHDEKFITSGLWSWSRHPNYVGELGLWTGVFALSASAIARSPYFPPGTIALAAASPVFTYLLLRYGSGVPLLEEAGDKRFGNDPKWEEYKRNVPVFWPKLF